MLATDGGGPDDPHSPTRVAKLEANVSHIEQDLAELKSDVREIRSLLREDFRLLFSALVCATLGLAALMAKGFQWL